MWGFLMTPVYVDKPQTKAVLKDYVGFKDNIIHATGQTNFYIFWNHTLGMIIGRYIYIHILLNLYIFLTEYLKHIFKNMLFFV